MRGGARRALRSRLAPLLLFVALGGGAARLPAQTVPRTDPRYGRHLEAVYTERVAALHRAELAADGPARERLGAEYAAAAERGPALDWPPRARVDRLRRVAEGGAAGVGSGLQRLAEALDLQVTPGAFTAADEGPLLTVRVVPLGDAVTQGTVTLRLSWHDGEGHTTVARSATVTAAAFAAPGFELFLRAPGGPPALHWLCLELEAAGERARGAEVPVEGVADLDVRWAALGEPQAADAELRAELELLLALGLRAPHGTAVETWLAALEGAPLDVPRPWPAGGPRLGSALGTASGAGPCLVLLPPDGVACDGIFAGPCGERWRLAAEELDAQVVALDPAVGAALPAHWDAIASAAGDRPLLICPRGRSFLSAAPLVLRPAAAPVHWLLHQTGPQPPLGGAFHGAVLAAANLGPGARARALQAPAWPFAAELELPRNVARYWKGHVAGDTSR
jgi:hypothetical protein